jgi:hypothetical protein
VTWFCFPGGWGCYNLNGIAEKELAATGAHGYATEAQAQAKLNASPTAAQQVLLQGFKISSSSPVGAGATGIQQTSSSSSSPFGTLAGFLGLSGKISGTNLVIRAVKVIIGGLLLVVGLVHLTGVSGSAADVARRVPLPV